MVSWLLASGSASAWSPIVVPILQRANNFSDSSSTTENAKIDFPAQPTSASSTRNYDTISQPRRVWLTWAGLALITASVSVVDADLAVAAEEDATVSAEWAYRHSTVDRRTGKANLAGTFTIYQDRLEAPPGITNKQRQIYVSLEYPSDWLELDRINQGIQYVDQRNGDKLYVFRLPLDQDLESTPKAYFGRAIFDPSACLAKSGTVVEDYKILSNKETSDGGTYKETIASPLPHRRLQAKYATVTPNGLRTERRGLLDIYQVNNYAFVLMTASNANKFLAGGIERETVERIANSFRVTVA